MLPCAPRIPVFSSFPQFLYKRRSDQGTGIGSMGHGVSWNFRRACSYGYFSRMGEEIRWPLPCPYLTTKNLLGPATSQERLGLQLSASCPALWLSSSCIPNSTRDGSCCLLPKKGFRTLPCPTIPSGRLLISCTWASQLVKSLLGVSC